MMGLWGSQVICHGRARIRLPSSRLGRISERRARDLAAGDFPRDPAGHRSANCEIGRCRSQFFDDGPSACARVPVQRNGRRGSRERRTKGWRRRLRWMDARAKGYRWLVRRWGNLLAIQGGQRRPAEQTARRNHEGDTERHPRSWRAICAGRLWIHERGRRPCRRKPSPAITSYRCMKGVENSPHPTLCRCAWPVGPRPR